MNGRRGRQGRRVAGRAATWVFALVVCAMPAEGHAQEDAVRAAIETTLSAWNRGDFDALAVQYASDARGFFLDGGALLRGFNRPALEAAYAAGFRAQMTARGIDVRLYGDVAVAVALVNGSLTLPDGSVQEGSWRYTETRVRRDGAWIVVQYHFSAMTARPGR